MIIKTSKRNRLNEKPRKIKLGYAQIKEMKANGTFEEWNKEFKPIAQKLKLPHYSFVEIEELKKRTFEVDSFFGIKGIYFLFDEKLNLVYIGESEDCLSRISTHFKKKAKEFKFFKIMKFEKSDLGRKQIEAKLIKQFNPRFNNIHNDKFMNINKGKVS